MIYGIFFGGLGNQMFIYAFLRALQLRTEKKAIIYYDEKGSDHNKYGLDHLSINSNQIYLQNSSKKTKCLPLFVIFLKFLVKMLHILSRITNKAIEETERIMQPLFNKIGIYIDIGQNFCFSKINFQISNFYFFGYFQNIHYFLPYEKTIKKELLVSSPPLGKNIEFLKYILNSNSICIHVRRGDYTSDENKEQFLVCTVQYYEQAIKEIKEAVIDPVFFIFSDDFQWTKENIRFEKDDHVVYVDWDNPPWEDLRLMYSCKHFIISNSTFSWWAQYLGKNEEKIVIAPSIWYKNTPKLRGDGLYLENWKLIPV